MRYPCNIMILLLCSLCCLLMVQTSYSQTRLELTPEEYLWTPQVSVLAFHNVYPVGKQGGIEIIQHDRRIATNGNVAVLLSGADAADEIMTEPIPQISNPERIVDAESEQIRIPFSHAEVNLAFELLIDPLPDHAFAVTLDFKEKPEHGRLEQLSFQMELYPEYYKGKSFVTQSGSGVFPQIFQYHNVNPDDPRVLASGRNLMLAAESKLYGLTIESRAGEIELVDDRLNEQRSWFGIRVKADCDQQENAVHLIFRPQVMENWTRTPVIAHSQVGYHPAQSKEAVLELDSRTTDLQRARLLRFQPDGSRKTVLEAEPERWGSFYRYVYGKFDFTEVRQDGLYQIVYDTVTTTPFRISESVYTDGVWQPSLLTFLPVQMCHMRVRDRNRLWHGLCHMDDGLQAPAPLPFYDGYDQTGETETDYQPNTTIPGMNQGGWHDAGDDDVNTGSSGRATYHLALTWEEFRPDIDKTSIDFDSRMVYLHQPDRLPDMIQHIRHGVDFLLAQYRAADHSFVGIISKDFSTYLQEGHWGAMTDNLFYDPDMPEDSKTGTHSGVFDDRYIFTNKDTRREYAVISYLCAASRALKSFYKEPAEECLATAQRIWDYEETHEPVFYASVGTPRNLFEQRINAAVELYLTTRDDRFLQALRDEQENIYKQMPQTAWTVSRVADHLGDSFRAAFEENLKLYQKELNEQLSKNPFGVAYEEHVWGFGWDILWRMYTHYYLIKQHPDIFTTKPLENVVDYMLGRHPASSLSLVSGVGAHAPIPAFGVNRSDYSYTPGGLYSGVNLIFPDFPELKPDHPYLWQQSEYIVFGATPFIFSVLALETLLDQ
ncbi:MAG: glycoside hydrolase family 9 protein [candidate division KSB1 bacterium]|nr:glycoside hydrolase family 9 protein [candidate division KSB1 bacterium]